MTISSLEKQCFEIIDSTEDEINYLNSINQEFKKYSEMVDHDRNFLNSIILRKRPHKVLEIGVAKGSSSIIILNAIKDIEGAHLYSCDYSKKCYNLPGKKTGFLIKEYPELVSKHTLYTGGLTYNFIDEIGNGIDLCFIDTTHVIPGEILDFLLVFPYLKPNATVVLHDINLQTVKKFRPKSQATNILLSALTGKKLLPPLISHNSELISDKLPNIGAVELSENINIFNLFNILGNYWEYRLEPVDIENVKRHFSRFYNEYFLNYFDEILIFQKFASKYQKKKAAARIYKKFIQNIFSVRNSDKKDINFKHKIITVLGIKFNITVKK